MLIQKLPILKMATILLILKPQSYEYRLDCKACSNVLLHNLPVTLPVKSSSVIGSILDSFTGVVKKDECLRIDQLMEHSTILNIQVWFLSKEAPKFTVGDLSDFAVHAYGDTHDD
jgi:hypothetical protein